MSRNDPKFPWRVMAISVLLFGVLAAVGWLIIGGPAGSGGEPPPATPATEPQATPTTGSQPAQPGAAAPPDPTAEGAPTTAQTADPEALADARAAAGTMDIQLFLIVPGLERLIPMPRTVAAPATLDGQVRRAIEELIAWNGTDTISPVSRESGIREVWVSRGGIAYVDFDQAFYDFSGGGSLGELHTIYGILHTLTESFPEVQAVQFLIDGGVKPTLAGHVDISAPLFPSNDWVLIERGSVEQPGRDSSSVDGPGGGV